MERGLAVTTVERTLTDLASMNNNLTLRRAVAQADHRNLLNPPALLAQLRRGMPGARAVREALDHHLPQLATTESELEVHFLLLLERAGLPIPETNVYVEGLKVDALFRAHCLVVELDGHATHANPPANETDRHRELILRRAGYTVVRYTWEQVIRRPEEVIADLLALLALPSDR
jgi:hypothetical protein